MAERADWLHDSLYARREAPGGIRSLIGGDEQRQSRWWSFHFVVRLKLDGADFFCRKAFGTGAIPDHLGLPLLAHRELKWYLDAFFFELVAAYDALLQELNVIYEIDSDIEDVKWERIKSKLPDSLRDVIEAGWQSDWFRKVRQYRNRSSHHLYQITGGMTGGTSSEETRSWEWDEHEPWIYFQNEINRNWEHEPLNAIIDYLKRMVEFISRVWDTLSGKFTPLEPETR